MTFLAPHFYDHALERVRQQIKRQRPQTGLRGKAYAHEVVSSKLGFCTTILDEWLALILILSIIPLFSGFGCLISFSRHEDLSSLPLPLLGAVIACLVLWFGCRVWFMPRHPVSTENEMVFNQIAAQYPDLLPLMLEVVGSGRISVKSLAYFLWAQEELKKATQLDQKLTQTLSLLSQNASPIQPQTEKALKAFYESACQALARQHANPSTESNAFALAQKALLEKEKLEKRISKSTHPASPTRL